ncbi:type II toxin-antitoxin system Phd/YefM family antitoxin [Candidatus Poriferisocius sp.]|uniref:type II toxin-antitoxin system Phd/YefM family antitoxin n=1 Tax=Candidatus Poriferisocius sp. TaxID=3101276 RepID=UPI003B023DA9
MELPPNARSIAISEFRQKCLSLLPEVAETGGEVIVTRRGRSLAVVSPVPAENSESIYELCSEGAIGYPDPTKPYFSDEQWDEFVGATEAPFGC